MQLYDIKEDKGYPEPEIVPDELGDYYLAEEVDKEIAALNATIEEQADWGRCREEYQKQIVALGEERKEWLDKAMELSRDNIEKQKQIADLKAERDALTADLDAALKMLVSSEPPYYN